MTEAPDGYGAPLVSVDVVAIALDPAGRPMVRVPRRRFEPFAGRRALPGVLLMDGERLREAAYRSLRVKGRIHPDWVRSLNQVLTFDTPGRDQRGPTISVAYLAVVEQVTAGPGWVPLEDPGELPFDHNEIINQARAFASERLWSNGGELARAFLGPRFASTTAAALMQRLDDGGVDRTNLPRFLKSRTFLLPAESKVTAGAKGGRPAAAWQFVAKP